MNYIDNKRRFMIYPDDKLKTNWDLLMSACLIFVCLVTPVRTAFVDQDNLRWAIINYTIDLMFLIDIVFSFNTAFFDEDFQIVHDRKIIACIYIKSWFFIDVVSIFPFDLILRGSDSASLEG